MVGRVELEPLNDQAQQGVLSYLDFIINDASRAGHFVDLLAYQYVRSVLKIF